jgi:hypothetical protein
MAEQASAVAFEAPLSRIVGSQRGTALAKSPKPDFSADLEAEMRLDEKFPHEVKDRNHAGVRDCDRLRSELLRVEDAGVVGVDRV